MIHSFTGHFSFLSNFEPLRSPIHIPHAAFSDLQFFTVEHAFQAAKGLRLPIGLARQYMQDVSIAPTPGKAKQKGRKVQLPHDWEVIKVDMMYQLLRQKFKDPALKYSLLATGDEELVKGNDSNDTFWGVCNGKGENMLGKLLMKIRSEIKEELN